MQKPRYIPSISAITIPACGIVFLFFQMVGVFAVADERDLLIGLIVPSGGREQRRGESMRIGASAAIEFVVESVSWNSRQP